MSSDPAVNAAARAWRDRYGDRLVGVEESAAHNGVGELTIAAAREALAPLRELHRHGECPENDLCELPDHLSLCVTCCRPWPCATAKLVYPAEELT